MFTAFKQYLLTLHLSPVSRKLYLSDLRRFLAWLGTDPTLSQVTSPNVYTQYLDSLKSVATAPSMVKRTVASLKQFGAFLAVTYSLPNPLPNPLQSSNMSHLKPLDPNLQHLSDYIKHFTNYLNLQHLSPLTIKSYKSDITRYLHWGSGNLPSNKLSSLLSDQSIQKYLNHLYDSGHALPSTIDRKTKSLDRFKAWYSNVYAPTAIADNTHAVPNTLTQEELAPLAPSSQPDSQSLIENSDRSWFFVKNFNYRTLITLGILLLFTSALAIFGYRQFSRDVQLTAAFPSTPVTPNRQLSFQGRLENAAGTPITVATNLTFKLFTAATLGTELYSSGACSLTPDSDGVFSTQIGSTCGAGIASSVFTENANVWLEVTVAAETLTPRQQIATVAYALNSETIQGFPISSTVSAIRNTVVPMNQWGEIIVGEQSPRLTGVSGTFAISAPSLSLTTTTGSNGNITLAPDGTGQVNLNGNTTSTNFFNVSNAQLTTGSLITGTAANNNTGFKLLDLLSGASPTSKFSVTDAGNVTLAGDLTITGGNITSATTFDSTLTVTGTTTTNGTFTANGIVNLGDGGDAITLNGSSVGIQTTGAGSDITLDAVDQIILTDFTTCTALETISGVLTCGSDGGGDGSSNWRIDSLGTISPVNDTLDLLVGSTATSSARAGFININSGNTPTATVSAGVTGGSFLTANGYLSTTARQTLTLGNSAAFDTTGNILLNPNGIGSVGIGTTGPDAKLDSLATAGEQLRLTYTDGSVYSGMTLNSSGNLTIDNTGTKTTITDDLEIVGDDLIMTTNTAGYLLIADGTNFNPTAVSGDITLNGAGLTAIGADKITEGMLKSVNGPTDELCLSYESTVGDFEWQTCGSGGGGSNWRIDPLGTISPVNDTLDLLVGSTATSSARAGFININSGNTPTATVSAGAAGGAFLTANGTLATTAKQTLTLGNASTGNVVIAPGGVTALTAIGANLTAAGNLSLTAATNLIFGGTTSLGESTSAIDSGAYLVGVFDEFDNSASTNVQAVLNDLDAALATALGGASLWTDGGAYLYPTSSEVLGNSASGTALNKVAGLYLADSSPLVFGNDNDISFSFSGSTLGSTLAAGSMIGIGTTTGLATLDVRGSLGTIPVASISGSTSQAALIVDNTVGDLFTASSSGMSRFVITQNGNVGIGVTAPTNKLEIAGTTSTISNSSGDLNIDSFSGNIVFGTDDDLIPTLGAGTANLGSSALPWDNLFATNLDFTAGASTITLKDNTASAFKILEGANSYFDITTTNTTENISFGNATTNPTFSFLGTGTTTFSGAIVANGSFTLGDNGDTGSINTSDWDINTTGDMSGIGTIAANGLLTLSADATMSGVLTVGNGTTNTIRTPYGPLNLAYKSGLNTWGTALTVQDTTGNVGIGTTAPTQKLEVNGNVAAQIFQDTAGTSTWYLDASSGSTSLAIQGDITNLDTSNPFTIASSGNQNITINAGTGTVEIGAGGAGKLDAATIDPPYTINGSKFATYMAGMTGVKEETTGNVVAEEYLPGIGYRATLDLADSPEGSDLWLFAKASNLKNTLDKLVVLLSASGNTKTWYDLDPVRGKLYLYSLTPTTLSYRLTAPRFDSYAWLNTRDPNAGGGLIVNDEGPWSVPTAILALINRDQSNTTPISPLPAGEPITLTSPLHIQPNPANLPDSANAPLLTVDGELSAATISARTAILQDVQVDTLTARNIIADTISANHIEGLDARIASLSTGLSDSEVETITTRIKDRLSLLSGNTPDASDLPIPEEATASASPYSSTPYNLSSSIASDSALLASLDADFVTINNYLAVIGSATITTLDITSHLYTASIESKTGLLSLAGNTLIVDSNGQVAINGDLTVSGKITATELNLERLNILNEQGVPVATIDASGSANLADLTTGMITIASSSEASNSATPSGLLTGITSSNATAGESTLVSPNTELVIESPYITSNSLVYLTPTGNTDNKVVFVKSKESCTPSAVSCKPSFTIGIDTPASSDISFNWWIIALKPEASP